MDIQTELKQAAEALRLGIHSEARRILDELVLREPDNAEAWQMLFSALENPLEKADCLKQVVRIHPKDEHARQKLKKYMAGAEYRKAKTASRYTVWQREEKEKEARQQKEGLKGFFSEGNRIGRIERDAPRQNKGSDWFLPLLLEILWWLLGWVFEIFF